MVCSPPVVPDHLSKLLSPLLSYSIIKSVDDLNYLLQSLGYSKEKKVHLFGHSYGGSLAYEYAKQHPEMIQSLILSNAANNMKTAEESYDRLSLINPLGFWTQNVCKVKSAALDDAMKHVGHVWTGMDVVLDYLATPMSTMSNINDKDAAKPKTLVITCKDDFGYDASQGWKELIGDNAKVQEVYLENCAHYPHLEDGAAFAALLDDFMMSFD